jgi:hypothetical protein
MNTVIYCFGCGHEAIAKLKTSCHGLPISPIFELICKLHTNVPWAISWLTKFGRLLLTSFRVCHLFRSDCEPGAVTDDRDIRGTDSHTVSSARLDWDHQVGHHLQWHNWALRLRPPGNLYTTCRTHPRCLPTNLQVVCTPHAEHFIHPRCLPTNLQVICTPHAEHFIHPRCLPTNLQVLP